MSFNCHYTFGIGAINVVHIGIKKPIRLLLDNDCFPAAVTLIYSGIDAMAFLSLPAEQTDVRGEDFVRWADRYIHFPCQAQIAGLDLYGARCSVVHTHGIRSKLSRQRKCKMIGYADHMIPEVRYAPEISADLVMVSIQGLADAYFNGVDRFLIDVFSDPCTAATAEERLKWMHHTLAFTAEVNKV
jgi:hypothetical protein